MVAMSLFFCVFCFFQDLEDLLKFGGEKGEKLGKNLLNIKS